MEAAAIHSTSGEQATTIGDGDFKTAITISDDLEVAEMGYTVDMNRKFTVWNIFAIGFTIYDPALSVVVALAAGLGNGGPITYVYAQLFIYAMSLCVAISLGELASAYPNSGGPYYWASQLAPDTIRRTTSFLVGIVSWVAAVFTTASVVLVTSQMVVGMVIISNPNVVSKPWIVFIGYQVVNMFVFGFNCFARILPLMSRIALCISICAIIISFVSMLAAASPTFQPASFVFATLVNTSGWTAQPIAIFTGAVGVNWGFSCLDAITHLAEEVPDPRKNVPKALLGSVFVGIFTSFPMTLAILFCIQDIEAVVSTPTGVPSIELFHQVFGGNRAAVVAVQSVVMINTVGSLWSCHAWQARQAWSFARDHGLPFSGLLCKVSGRPYHVPLYAHAWSCFWVGVLGCLYLGSTVAFSSFVAGAIMMQYVTYSTCILLLLFKGRSTFQHGPFWMKRFGPVANFVTIAWTVFTTVFYSFPPALPVTAGNMNYVSVVMVGIFTLVAVWYGLVARKYYEPPAKMP